MEEKFTNIKERILYFAKYQGISLEIFFEQIGMTYGSFKGKSKETPINSNALANIIAIYPDVNPEWLLTGQGSMLKDQGGHHNIVIGDGSAAGNNNQVGGESARIAFLEEQVKFYKEKIAFLEDQMKKK